LSFTFVVADNLLTLFFTSCTVRFIIIATEYTIVDAFLVRSGQHGLHNYVAYHRWDKPLTCHYNKSGTSTY